jgi:hypothetical protein
VSSLADVAGRRRSERLRPGDPVEHVGGCVWGFGNNLPGATSNFGRNAQYGSLLSTTYLAVGGGGATVQRINNFRQILSNPCPAGNRE